MKEKNIGKLDFIKMKSLCSLKSAIKKMKGWPDMVVHICNHSTWEIEAGGLQV
jgi:hypothetical protein